MDYKLAKQLKEAGFPQERGGYYFNGEYGSYNVEDEKIRHPLDYNLVTKDPSLEELIEAVSNHPVNRRDIGIHGGGDNWTAWARKTLLDENGDGDRYCVGSTPTEAVAKLYLELNKK
jgi:hypothetical protein